MKKIYIILITFAALCCTACDDWLDVRGETEVKEKDLFQNYKGFRDALTGCYMSLGSQDIYGEKLTMTHIESLANLWIEPDDDSSIPADYYLYQHDYVNESARSGITTIYQGLFNVITQVNKILNNLEENGHVIPEASRTVIEGEAYAMRALCQMDILRLFGQMPQGASTQVMLPYSETATIDVMPSYYSFTDFVKKLEEDFTKAEALLKENDPIFDYTFEDLEASSSSILDDDYLMNRRFRLNYWAVRALHARLYLYLGQNAQAYSIAKELIDGKDADGLELMPLSGSEDISAGNFACPTECLFALSKYNLIDYTIDLLIGGSDAQVRPAQHFVITQTMLGDLYAGQSTTSNNRYLNVWNRNAKDMSGVLMAATKKYWYDETAEQLMFKHQLIPMVRMSEIYLIAMETSGNLTEINELYRTYMRAQNVQVLTDKFASLDEVQPEVINEYRREFYGEGHMFYTYKRTGATQMQWRKEAVEEKDYIIPLPESEFNPNDIKK